MWKLVLGFIFIALILLIMRISHLNEKIASMDEQLSDFVTHEYLEEFIQIKHGTLSKTEMQTEIQNIKERLRTQAETGDQKKQK